ncbi:MAG: aldose 1-epimerase family protein [Planctomycetaceae bacterium]|nr:aldose 1-epimerase family protein [Planctomycetaceae bacterium]
MPVKTWQLVNQGFFGMDPVPVPEAISDDDLPGLGDAGVMTRTWRGGLADGVFSVEINTGRALFNVLPTRGMGVWRAHLKTPEGWELIGWKSPVRGPVHPAFVDLGEPSGLGWLDGFDELLARCGLESNGAPEFDDTTERVKYPLHGRIANKPAHRLDLTIDTQKQEIKLVGIVEETRFHFFKLRLTSTVTTKFGSTALSIHDEVENFSASPTTAQLLYHVNFGLPLLDGGSRVVVPVKTLVPRNAHAASGIKTWDSYSAPEPGFEEMVYFFELFAADDGQTRALLKNAHSTRGVSLMFNTKQLPCFTVWKNTTGEPDGYVTGLEPGTNFPNPRSFETAKNRVVKLAGGQKQTFDLTLEVHGSAADVTAAEAAVTKLQAGRPPKIHPQPLLDWCA